MTLPERSPAHGAIGAAADRALGILRKVPDPAPDINKDVRHMSKRLMSELGQSRPNWAVRAKSDLPPIVTGQQTFPFGSFVPTAAVDLPPEIGAPLTSRSRALVYAFLNPGDLSFAALVGATLMFAPQRRSTREAFQLFQQSCKVSTKIVHLQANQSFGHR